MVISMKKLILLIGMIILLSSFVSAATVLNIKMKKIILNLFEIINKAELILSQQR